MKSMCKPLAMRVFAWVLIAVLTAQTALVSLPQTAYAADMNESASVTTQVASERINAVLTDYQPTVIAYTDPISGFTHPGVGVTKTILENVQTQVRNGVEPWKSYFETMLLDNAGVSGKAVTPSWTSGKALDSQSANSAFIADASKAYAQAVMYFITGDNVYRKNALTIIRAYEAGNPEDMKYFTDACIHTGIPTNRICIAAEIIRYSSYAVTTGYTEEQLKWTDEDTEKFISNFISPNIEVFQSSPDRFMNQHNYTNIGVMSAALFMDDRENYEKAVEWFTVNRSAYNQGYNGSILRLFREIKTVDTVGEKEGTGTPLAPPVIQHMEMGRDQAHGCGDLTNAAIMSRLMLAQGTKVNPEVGTVSTESNAVDIYRYLDNRLVKTANFFFKFMLGYDSVWTPAAFATRLDGTIRDMYASFSAEYRGRYDTINFWDYYSYYRYTAEMTPEQIKAAYPYFYEGFQQLKYTTWNNADGGGDFWLFLPAAAAGDTSYIPKSPANKADETKFEMENRGNVVSADKQSVPLTTEGGVTYFRIPNSAGAVKIGMNTAATTSDTLLFRVRTDGVAKLTMSGGPTGTIYLPSSNGQWVDVTYNKTSDDVLNTDTNMYWFTVSDLEGTYVDVDYIDIAPTEKIAFTSGREDFSANTYVGATFNMQFGATPSNVTYSLINAPTDASVSGDGTVTWNPSAAGTNTFYVQAAIGDIVALKKIVLTVSTDRAAAVASASSAYNEKAIYTTATKSAYQTALKAANEAINGEESAFSKKLNALSLAVANLELVSPLLENDPLTDGTSLDYSKMNIGPNTNFGDITSQLLDAESGTRLRESSVPFIMDFGFDYKVSVTKFGVQARAGFSNRLAGMNIYGSNDGTSWDKLTVAEAKYQQAYQIMEVDPQFQGIEYRYLKFQQDNVQADVLHDLPEPQNFQFAELRIWGTRVETGNPLENISFTIGKEAKGRIEVGGTVAVSIQAREALNGLTVKIAGKDAQVTSGADNTYTATLQTEKSTPTGMVSVEVTCNLSGDNAGTVTISGTTDGSTVILTNQDNFIDTGAKAAVFTSNINPPSITREQNTRNLFDKNLTTRSDLSGDDGYHIIDFGAGVKVALTEALILPRFDDTIAVAERTNGTVIYGTNDEIAVKADGTFDDSKVTWTALTSAVTGASWGTANNPDVFNAGGSGMWSYMAPLDGIGETGYRYFKIGGGKRGSAAEVEFYGTLSSNLDETAKAITSLPDQEAGATKLNCPGISSDVTVTVKSSNPTGVVDGNGTITPPLDDTKVKLVLTLTASGGASADTSEIEVTFKGLKSLLTAPTYTKGDTALTLPTVPEGYTVSVSSSSNETVIVTETGVVTAQTNDTEVRVKLKLTRTSDSSNVESGEFTVTIPGTGGAQKIEISSTDYNITASSNRNNSGKGTTVKGMAELLFDNDTSTFGDLTDSEYFYIIDFGPDKAVNPTEFLLHPRATSNNLADRMNGTIISGSNNYSTWTQITDAVSGVKNTDSAWVDVALKNDVTIPENGYRYLRISGASYGNIAEVRIFGTVNTVEKQDGLVSADEFTISGNGSATGVQIVDGKWNTGEDMRSSKSAYYTIDFGENQAITPTKFHLSPYSSATNESDSKNCLSDMNGTTIYGSNNGSNWTALTSAVSGTKYGWNVVTMLDSVKESSYRYLKIENTAKGVALSEIEIYGTVGEGTGEPDPGPEPPEEKEPLKVLELANNIIASTNRNSTGTVFQMAELLFDDNSDTYGDLTVENGCFYVIDFGLEKAVNPTEFQLHPRATSNNLADRMNGTIISGSNDYSTWTQITDAVSGVKNTDNAWVDVALKNDVTIPENGYRYLKISGAKWGNIAEVRIFGTVNDVSKPNDLVTVNADMISVTDSSSAAGTSIVDGKWNTGEDMRSNKSAYYTIDFGENQAITPTKFHLSPYSSATTENDSKAYLTAMNGTTIYGSNSTGDEWTEIASLTSDGQYGWNVLNVTATGSYRYLKIANTNGVALSEIEIYGTVGEGTGETEPDVPDPPEEKEPLNVSNVAYNITASTNRSNIGTVFQMAEQLFDGNTNTYGDLLVENEGFYVIDFGPGKAVNPTEFQLYPRATDNNLADRMNGAIISGSNDYSTWVQITDAVSGVNGTDRAWVDAALKNNVTIPENGYRYLKISGAKWGNIAEVRIYGSVGESESQIKPVPLDGATIEASAGKDSVTAVEMATRITDGNFNTYGDMTGGRNANFIIDFGDGKAVTPTKFHLYPRSDDKESDGNKYRDRMNQTIIYGSNDKSSWTALTDAVTSTQYGWNVVTLKGDSETQGYRYLKITGADGGAIAEIEIYGTVNLASSTDGAAEVPAAFMAEESEAINDVNVPVQDSTGISNEEDDENDALGTGDPEVDDNILDGSQPDNIIDFDPDQAVSVATE